MTTKTIFPYVWVWSARIDNYSGEVRVRLTERKKDESMHEADYVEFRYSAETVVSYLKSHCAHNKFREVNYEGEQAREFYRLRDVCEREVMHHRDSLIFRGEITPFIPRWSRIWPVFTCSSRWPAPLEATTTSMAVATTVTLDSISSSGSSIIPDNSPRLFSSTPAPRSPGTGYFSSQKSNQKLFTLPPII